jgi:hypothetical protein
LISWVNNTRTNHDIAQKIHFGMAVERLTAYRTPQPHESLMTVQPRYKVSTLSLRDIGRFIDSASNRKPTNAKQVGDYILTNAPAKPDTRNFLQRALSRFADNDIRSPYYKGDKDVFDAAKRAEDSTFEALYRYPLSSRVQQERSQANSTYKRVERILADKAKFAK